jgi:hypothetical protein
VHIEFAFHIYSHFTGHVVHVPFNCTAILRDLNSTLGTWYIFYAFEGRLQEIKGRVRKADV